MKESVNVRSTFLLDSIEKLLSMASDLSSGATSNVIFDFFPIFTEQSHGLDEFLVLGSRPPTRYSFLVVLRGVHVLVESCVFLSRSTQTARHFITTRDL